MVKKVQSATVKETPVAAPSTSAAQVYAKAERHLADAKTALQAHDQRLAGIGAQLAALDRAEATQLRVLDALASQVAAAKTALRKAKNELPVHAGSGDGEAEAQREVDACANALQTLRSEFAEEERAAAELAANAAQQRSDLEVDLQQAQAERDAAALAVGDLEHFTEQRRIAAGKEAIAAAAEHKKALVARLAEARQAAQDAEGDLEAAHAHAEDLARQHPDLGAEILASGAAAHPAEAALDLLDRFDAYLQALKRAAGGNLLHHIVPGMRYGGGYLPGHDFPRLLTGADVLTRETLHGLLAPGGESYRGAVERVRELVAEMRQRASAADQLAG